MLDTLVETMGWTRGHAHRAIRAANARTGAARDVRRKPRPRKYSYDALVVLQEVWALSGQPSGYLAAVMDDTLKRLRSARACRRPGQRHAAVYPWSIDKYLALLENAVK